MSRKHALLPDTDGLTVAKAISLALNDIWVRGGTVPTIVMSPEVQQLLQGASLGYWKAGPGRYSLFNVSVEIDRSADGWAIRVK